MDIQIILNEFSTVDEVTELGKLAEDYGLKAVWTSTYASSRDSFMSLVPLARESKKITLGPLAVSPYEMHPIKIANALYTLNELSGGRACILLGAGGGLPRAMKIKWTRMVRTVRECVDIVKGAPLEEVYNYDGEIYNVFDYRPSSWVTDEPPIIYVAASREQMLRMGTRVGDGVMMSDVPIERMDESMKTIREGLAANGRSEENFRINNFWAWHVKENKEDAIAEARIELVWRGVLTRWVLEPYLSKEDCDLVETNWRAFHKAFMQKTPVIEGVPDHIVDALVENLSFTGDLSDLDRIIERLKAFEAAGLTEIALRMHQDQASAIKLIGEKIAPAFA